MRIFKFLKVAETDNYSLTINDPKRKVKEKEKKREGKGKERRKKRKKERRREGGRQADLK